MGWIDFRFLTVLFLDIVASQSCVDQRLLASLTKGFENNAGRAVVCACDFLVW